MDDRILRGLGPRAVAAAAELDSHVGATVVGLAVAESADASALTRTLADQLVRQFRRFAPVGPTASRALTIAAEETGQAISLESTSPAISIGVGVEVSASPRIYIGSDGWRAHVSRRAPQPLGRVGLGGPAAAFLGSIEVFKEVFEAWIDDVELVDDLHLSMYDWSVEGRDPGPPIDDVELGDTVWVGIGAVAHGGLAALRELPSVHGRLELVDPDVYGSTALHRYPATQAAWDRASKPEAMAAWLTEAHPRLLVVPRSMDANSWYVEHRPGCRVQVLVTTPDSAEARRHLAMKLPEVAINGYAERFDIGVGMYKLGQGPCLGCRYPMEGEALNELALLHNELGLEPHRIRVLLDAVAPLTAEDVEVIQARYQLDATAAAALVGQPLRSVREHLCAVGRITAPNTDAVVDVPLGCVSGFAGVAVASELVRHAMADPRPPGWKANLKQPIPSTAAWPQAASPSCFVCADADYAEVHRVKYER